MALHWVADGGVEAAIILNKQSQAAERRWSSTLGVRQGVNNTSPKKSACYV